MACTMLCTILVFIMYVNLDVSFRASPAIAKITTEKVQIIVLATYFFIHTQTDFPFHSLFSLNVILC